MTLDEKEYNAEKMYLKKVRELLLKIINSENEKIGEKKENITNNKKFIWDNLSDYTDEERVLFMNDTDREVETTNSDINLVYKYNKALNCPYFGKITFRCDEHADEMNIYIGITSVKDNMEFYVFDWRSPIASMFYNYELGMAKYDAPAGEICGEITEKMQFKIVNGKLLRCFKSDINIDDEYLQDILANSSTEKMKNIVSTIQREQNEIIRNNNDKYMIVQGVAGSGKTSVALHRIAYLLYKDIKLSSNNILIFSPSDVFSNYISEVLPELGEENVLSSTFSDFASSFLKQFKNIESFTEFLERVYNSKVNNEEIKLKLSDDYKSKLDKFLEQYERKIVFETMFVYKNKVISTQKINDMFHNKYKKFPIKERINEMSDAIRIELGLTKKSYNKIRKQLISNSNIIDNYIGLYKLFCDQNNLSFITKNRECNKILYEDITGLLYILFYIEGYPNYNYIRQVVIDEVQDYTKFQMYLIKRIFDKSSFTLLGDINQTINPYYNYDSLEDLSVNFIDSRYLELTKTYRSSEEIIEYSNQILGLNNVCSIRKNLDIPVSIKAKPQIDKDDLINDINKMRQDGINKIAIITKNIEEANKIYEMLNGSNKIKVQLITTSETNVHSSIVIIPSYLAKGLEFDAVIAWNNDNNNYTYEERKLYYVVCTRAQHKLNIYNEPEYMNNKVKSRNLYKNVTYKTDF